MLKVKQRVQQQGPLSVNTGFKLIFSIFNYLSSNERELSSIVKLIRLGCRPFNVVRSSAAAVVCSCVFKAMQACHFAPIFVNKKLEQDPKPKEIKLSIISHHCLVYKFVCDLCNVDYVGCTVRHLHQRFADHNYLAIGEHFLEALGDIRVNFMFLRSAMDNFDCLIYEML